MKIELDININVDDADEEKTEIAMEIATEEAQRFARELRDRLERQGLRITDFSAKPPRDS